MHTESTGGLEILACPPPPTTTDIVLLPRSVADGESVFSTNTGAVVKLLRSKGLAARRLEVDGRVLYRDERGLPWLGPVIFVAAAAYTSNPHVVDVSLSIIANYLTALFRGSATPVDVKLEIIAEVKPEREYCRINYEGSVDGLKGLSAVVDSAMGNDRAPAED